MGATKNTELLKEMTVFITDRSRDQDIIYFFASLATNFKARRLLTKYLQDNYDAVRNPFILKQLFSDRVAVV